jgi:hypothetical protein
MAKGEGRGRNRIRDGRSRHRCTQECGVFTPHGFCECPQKRWGRCEYHIECLKADSHFEMLRTANAADRKRILAVLDNVQKVRPHYEYENPEGEAELIAAAAQEMENSEMAQDNRTLEEKIRDATDSNSIRDLVNAAYQPRGTYTRNAEGGVDYDTTQQTPQAVPSQALRAADNGMLIEVWESPDGRIRSVDAYSPSGLDALTKTMREHGWKRVR